MIKILWGIPIFSSVSKSDNYNKNKGTNYHLFNIYCVWGILYLLSHWVVTTIVVKWQLSAYFIDKKYWGSGRWSSLLSIQDMQLWVRAKDKVHAGIPSNSEVLALNCLPRGRGEISPTIRRWFGAITSARMVKEGFVEGVGCRRIPLSEGQGQHFRG